MLLKLFLFLFIFNIKEISTENCAVNSLFNSTCSLGELLIEPEGLDVKLDGDNCNTIYKKEDFAAKPNVKYYAAQEGKLYTLVMADPDAVNIKPETYVLHWLVTNIEGKALANGNITEALTVKAYHPPSPPANSGTHRYQFTLYTQDKKLYGTIAHADRANFLLESWLEGTNQKICGPIAGQQFRVIALTTNNTNLST